jgi:hypothetical protein
MCIDYARENMYCIIFQTKINKKYTEEGVPCHVHLLYVGG